jgi:hypothetical protein
VVTDQTALELVFAKNIFAGTGLTVLKTPFGLDDLLFTTAPGGTLYVVDKGPTASLPKVPAATLYKVTGPFAKNTLLAANDGQGEQVVTVNLNNGNLTPFVQNLQTSKGLVYVEPSGSAPQLTLNGNPVAPAASVSKSKSSSSNTGLIFGIIAAALVLLAAGIYAMRRRPAQ